ncbi:hypothetical protein LJK88_45770 [Paenibacillus sp. P26]|nr:hypothetical protein LJK88_45770 [Paenibacillus sp. P26]UUZ92066.1 hypothetical protein LJK87_42600 [Paenibacillus sp. P25]
MAMKIAKGIMWFCAIGAFAAFFTGFESAFSSENDHRIVELWRLLGFIVFTALFILLALRPSQYPGIWEVVIFHKLAMSVISFNLLRDQVPDAGSVAIVDGILAVLLITAYFLSKSYTLWRLFGQSK